MSEKLKIGVAGAGHLGNFHLNCINLSDKFELIGVYDIDQEKASKAREKHQVKVYTDLEEMLNHVDLLDVVTPTTTHLEIASMAIRANKHVFIEKPVCSTPEEARALQMLNQDHGVKIQIGHVERFNPAILALKDVDLKPGFIEGHRLAMFNPRGTDVSVVLDLMIHDLDLILKIVNSKVIDIQSKRVAVVSHSDDICNARLTFENGCIVNLTASRISLKNMRKLRMFQQDAYISVDMLEKQTQIIKLEEAAADEDVENVLQTVRGPKTIDIRMPEIQAVNAIKMELETFHDCIVNNKKPYVTLEDGIEALDLAYKIIANDKMD